MYVLIVEDDVSLAAALQQILKDNDYQVDMVHDGRDGLDYALTDQYDVIVLDVMLPKLDGFSVVTELRRQNISTPVLLLTAKGEIRDKIAGLDAGADDYMTKPFAPSELLAHLRALTRRKGEVVFETINAFDLELNLESMDLTCGEKTIHLSRKEFQLAEMLMNNEGIVITKETLIDKIWGYDSTAEDNNVEAYVSFLRKKLKFLKSEATIENIRKVGYRLIKKQDA